MRPQGISQRFQSMKLQLFHSERTSVNGQALAFCLFGADTDAETVSSCGRFPTWRLMRGSQRPRRYSVHGTGRPAGRQAEAYIRTVEYRSVRVWYSSACICGRFFLRQSREILVEQPEAHQQNSQPHNAQCARMSMARSRTEYGVQNGALAAAVSRMTR